MEQIAFTSEQQRIRADQALEQARVAEGSARSALMILGYDREEVERMDPLSEGEEVAHYTIDAPFAGTITAKDVVLDERVGPDTKLFELTDLSTRLAPGRHLREGPAPAGEPAGRGRSASAPTPTPAARSRPRSSTPATSSTPRPGPSA